MQLETDYKFQHEENPVLADEAAASLNRTLWVQHWERVRKAVRIEVLFATFCGLFCAGLGYIDWSKPSWASGPITSIYFLLLFGSIGLAALITLIRYGPKLPILSVREVMKRPKYALNGCLVLLLVGALLGVFRFTKNSIGYGNVLAFVYMACCDWYEMRKLRKNMINWGLIEANGKPLIPSSPIVAQLNEAEAVIDNSLGKPKRKLFRKAIINQ
jgi:hypothetical protein